MLKDTGENSSNEKIYNWLNAGLTQIFLGCISLLWSGQVDINDWLTPACFNIISGIFLLPSIIKGFRHKGNQLLVDHLLILAIMFFIYYVFGALLIQFGSKEEVDITLNYYPIDAKIAMRVIALNCIGFGLALVAGAIVGRRFISRLTKSAIRSRISTPEHRVIFAFVLIGGSAFIYTTITDLNLNAEVISGTWRMLSQLSLIAIFTATAYRGKYSIPLMTLAIFLIILQLLAGLLMFNKSTILQSIAIFFVGLAWRFNSSRIILPGFVVIIAVYIAIGGLVSQARAIMYTDNRADFSDRISILKDVILIGSKVVTSDRYGYWNRFSYLVPQGAAVDLYDRGNGGNDYSLLGWSFLPRTFFPDKPIMTDSSRDFHYKISGSMSSSTGHGVFVNGYYNLGWGGTVIVGILVGCFLAWTSAMTAVIFKARALLWIPFALLGCFMAFNINSNFVESYWGSFVLLIYAVLAGLIFQRILPMKKSMGACKVN